MQAKGTLAAQREAVFRKILLFDPTFSTPFMDNEMCDKETDALIEKDMIFDDDKSSHSECSEYESMQVSGVSWRAWYFSRCLGLA